jgi:NAD+ dependent glucose-6-phosphate dehydrogenase
MTRVLLTGANGDVGRYLVPHLRTAHDLRIGIGPPPRGEEPVSFLPGDDVHEIDLANRDSLVAAMHGIDAVVHLAAQRDFYASWEDLRGPNIDGVLNVFQVAHHTGVRKVVFASSNHVTGGYDQRHLWPIRSDFSPWPDSLYGATKAFGEALGRYVAYSWGMSVICLRIGWVLEQPHNEMALRLWLSPGDLCRLIDCSLAAIVQYGVYYGVSANTRCTYDMDPARRELGYIPHDDSERFAPVVLHRLAGEPAG